MPDSNLTASQLLFWSGQKLHEGAPIYNMVSAATTGAIRDDPGA